MGVGDHRGEQETFMQFNCVWLADWVLISSSVCLDLGFSEQGSIQSNFEQPKIQKEWINE